MSRSCKKNAIYKDKGVKKKNYWSIVRSNQKNEIRSGKHPQDISDPKEIVNDYDYCDYIITCTNKNCYCMKNHGFKKCMKK